jgi:hypothetical protein
MEADHLKIFLGLLLVLGHKKKKKKKKNSVASVREQTISTERPPFVNEVSANLC